MQARRRKVQSSSVSSPCRMTLLLGVVMLLATIGSSSINVNAAFAPSSSSSSSSRTAKTVGVFGTAYHSCSGHHRCNVLETSQTVIQGVFSSATGRSTTKLYAQSPQQARGVQAAAAPPLPPPPLPNFCANCGAAAMELKVPDNDERLRAVCGACGRVEYSNPKIVVSAVIWSSLSNNSAADEDSDDMKTKKRVLLAKRAIEPRAGYWGIPQGYMEQGETTREAVVREVHEETGRMVDIQSLKFRAVYNVPGSVQLVYEGHLLEDKEEEEEEEDKSLSNGNISVTTTSTFESSEIGLFEVKDIPYDQLCFPTVQWALEHCLSKSDQIQQRTKLYDANLDQWTVIDDEPINNSP